MRRACCRKVETVWYFDAISTLTGLRRQARCNFCTFEVIVALYSCVLRSRGITCTLTRAVSNPGASGRRPQVGPHLQNLIQLLLEIQGQDAVRLIQHQMLQLPKREPLRRHGAG